MKLLLSQGCCSALGTVCQAQKAALCLLGNRKGMCLFPWKCAEGFAGKALFRAQQHKLWAPLWLYLKQRQSAHQVSDPGASQEPAVNSGVQLLAPRGKQMNCALLFHLKSSFLSHKLPPLKRCLQLTLGKQPKKHQGFFQRSRKTKLKMGKQSVCISAVLSDTRREKRKAV